MTSRKIVAVCLVLVAAAFVAPATAQNVETGGGQKLSIKGFVSATLFVQDQNFAFGNGQPAEFPLPPEVEDDEWFLDGDLRNTRITLAFEGPEVEKWKFGAVIESDFFGGFNGTGAFSDEQPTPRLRLAYVDVHRGRTTYRLGQAWTPLFGNVPVSLSHIAFPLGYGSAGMIGWRFPGLFVYHPLSDAGAEVQTKLTLAAFRGSWDGPGSNLGGQSAGNASLIPQLEARLDFSGNTASGGTWGAYLVGHYDQKDLSGVGVEVPGDELDGYAAQVGARFKSGRFMLHGNLYWADSIGQQFAHITQFGEMQGVGGWVQAGYNLTDRLAGYLFYGMADPDDEDVLAARGDAGRLENTMLVGSVIYSVGPYGFSLEWLRAELESGFDQITTEGNQLSMSAIYRF